MSFKSIISILLVIILVAFVCVVSPYLYAIFDRNPSIPRQEKESIKEISEALDFPVVYPNIEDLHQKQYSASFYLTTIPNPSGESYSKPVVTGYSIMLSSIEEISVPHIEYRGTNLERENGNWALFDEINYTCIKREIPYEIDDLIIFYSEYRPYPYNDYEVAEQKRLPSKSPEGFDTSTFTIFHAYVIFDGIRYDVIYSDLSYSDVLETECIENASDYFENLL